MKTKKVKKLLEKNGYVPSKEEQMIPHKVNHVRLVQFHKKSYTLLEWNITNGEKPVDSFSSMLSLKRFLKKQSR